MNSWAALLVVVVAVTIGFWGAVWAYRQVEQERLQREFDYLLNQRRLRNRLDTIRSRWP